MAFKHILVPTDFSECSRLAAETAAAIAAPGESSLTLHHVIELPLAYLGEPQTLDFLDSIEQTSARDLAAWAAGLAITASVPVTTRTTVGKPAPQILEMLERDRSIDLVVVGSHGRIGISRVLLGSVAERVMRHAPCAVLVARVRA